MQKLLFSFALFFGYFAFGQFKINGQVLDENNRPIQGCHIHLGNKNTISDNNGFYEFNSISKGKIKMYVSSLGYISVEKKIVIENNLVQNDS